MAVPSDIQPSPITCTLEHMTEKGKLSPIFLDSSQEIEVIIDLNGEEHILDTHWLGCRESCLSEYSLCCHKQLVSQHSLHFCSIT